MKSPKERFKRDMRRERSESGFLTRYLAWMRSFDPEGAETLEADLAETFATDEGLRVLKLFEKSVLLSSLPDGSDDRALREKNAVANFVLEIRRIVSHGA